MKLPASILATLCAAGCGAATTQYVAQPVQVYELVDPRLETIEATEFAQPPEEATRFAQPPDEPTDDDPEFGILPRPPQFAPAPPQPVHVDPDDNCPACGMG